MDETAYWIESGGASRIRVECIATASESGPPCECPTCRAFRAQLLRIRAAKFGAIVAAFDAERKGQS